MNRITQTLAVIIISLIGCKEDKKGFEIFGHINGIEDGTLIKLIDRRQQISLDSAYSINGDFILKGKVDHATSCIIICNNEGANIQVENVKMTFNSSLNNLDMNSSITGGEEQKLINELNVLYKPYVDQYSGALDSLQNEKYNDEGEKRRLIERYKKLQPIAHKILEDFATKHVDTYFGLDIVYRNRKRFKKDSLKTIYENLPQPLKEAEEGKGLKIYIYEELIGVGKPFIDFVAKDLSGNDFKLSDLSGKNIYLSFWGTGCPPCRMENKYFSKNFHRIPKELSIVSFSIDKDKKSWNDASQKDSVKWINVSDLEGSKGAIKTRYGVQAIPNSFLIDKDGIITKIFYGFNPNEDLIEILENIITEEKG